MQDELKPGAPRIHKHVSDKTRRLFATPALSTHTSRVLIERTRQRDIARGNMLVDHLRRCGVTVRQLAAAMGVSESMAGHVCSGDTRMPYERYVMLCKAMGLTVADVNYVVDAWCRGCDIEMTAFNDGVRKLRGA